MTRSQIATARELQDDGRSLQYIADQLGVSKSALHRALKEDDTMPIGGTPGEDPAAEPTTKPTEKRPAPAISGNVELGKLDLELSHEREMTKLKIKQDELAVQRRQNELAAEQVEADKKMLAIRERQIAAEQQAEEDKVTAHRDMLVDRHNRLVRELLKNCEDSTWSEHEVDEYIDRVKTTQKKVTRFCEQQAIDEDGLAIYRNLSSLLKLVEKIKEDESGFFSSDVTFDFDKAQVKEVKGWLIEDFEDEYVKPAKKKSADEDDDEKDDEDDSDDDEKELSSHQQEKELLKDFRDLIEELTDNSKDSEWSVKDYEAYQDRIESFSVELTTYMKTLDKPVDADTLAIRVHTDQLYEYVDDRTAVVDEDDDTLTITLSVNDRAWLKSLPSKDFYEEVEDDDEEPETPARKANR